MLGKKMNLIKNGKEASKKKRLGQSTMEYVLMLVLVAAAVKMVGGTFKDRLNDLVGKAFTKADQAVEQ